MNVFCAITKKRIMRQKKSIFIIAGPNGAGKTTTALSVFPSFTEVYEFINADEIARGLAPLHPESMALMASKLMIKRLQDLLKAEKSFAFETTASGRNYIKYLNEAREKKYEIHLMYLWLNNDNLAVERVAKRVAQGGHHIPEETIRKRYSLGIINIIKYYLPLAYSAVFLDNSNFESQEVIAEKKVNDNLRIGNVEIWNKINRLANV